MMAVLAAVNGLSIVAQKALDLQLDGGAADEEGISSSASRDRLRLRVGARPRFAADMLGLKGELMVISKYIDVAIADSNTSLASGYSSGWKTKMSEGVIQQSYGGSG